MKLSIGTSGYSYKEWKGPFYPEKLPARGMLAYYAGQLPAVEINNTFYRMPKSSVLESWCEQIPQDFRFAIKASPRITHFKRLKEAEEPTEFLLNAARVLGERLGVLLFQLPPNLKLDLDRLKNFVELLPEGTRAAFEFRHPSWFEAGARDLLRSRDFALVHVDGGDAEASVGEFEATASWGYMRLRRPDYERENLAAWAQRIRNQALGGGLRVLQARRRRRGPGGSLPRRDRTKRHTQRPEERPRRRFRTRRRAQSRLSALGEQHERVKRANCCQN